MEHLPECHLTLEPLLSAQDWCICVQLRACERRVRDRIVLPYNEQIYEDGYAAGVQVARDAVAALDHDTYCYDHDCRMQRASLAAIDALRGES